MAIEMAERLGLENGVEVVNVSFDALVAGRLDNFDIALSQVTITDERAEVVDFTVPYFESNQGVMVLDDSDVEVTSVEDAQSIQWGVQNGTMPQTFLIDEVQPDSEPQAYRETDQLFNALRAGRSTRYCSIPRSWSGRPPRTTPRSRWWRSSGPASRTAGSS